MYIPAALQNTKYVREICVKEKFQYQQKISNNNVLNNSEKACEQPPPLLYIICFQTPN